VVCVGVGVGVVVALVWFVCLANLALIFGLGNR